MLRTKTYRSFALYAMPTNLRWSPNFSSFKTKQFLKGFSLLYENNSMGIGMDWSIREYENVEVGDWWILSRVGGKNNGIVGIGKFSSLPKPGESWRKDDSIVHYADLHILALQQPEKTNILTASELKKTVPEIDWDKGSSGVLIEESAAEKLALVIVKGLLSVGEENCNNSDIAVRSGAGGCFTLICSILSQLCPATLKELKQTQDAIPAIDRDHIPEYLDEIVYDEDAVKAGKPLEESLILLSWENIIPWENFEKRNIKEEYEKIIIMLEEEEKKCLPELPDYWETSPAIKAEIELLARNLQETVDFLDNDCTGEQLVWLSEVFEEISAKLQSWDFIDALHRCADKYPEECKVYNIRECIEYAIGQLNDDVYQQRFPLKND